MAKLLLRLACSQHVKRTFLDCGDDFDACRLQGVNFFEYISDVINKAAALPPRTPLSKYRDLLPDKWKQKNIAQE
ncbi:hypothetical protein [uncultured Prevotella sp.]|uniref:hypothetical protein n=1 Tax=uncultured Prevotella sp. TaxID=159272 RepID=UPI00261FD1E2|nr:hypothetical protein [uncultured Prevotella sp.]